MPRKAKPGATKPKRAARKVHAPEPVALDGVSSYRHKAKRKNIPPAGLAAQGKVREAPKIQYAYNPHRPPILRFDPSGSPDKLPELLQTARTRPLKADEAKVLADALRNQEPWLEWSGKREKKTFEVDPVALHIHERVSTQAILKIAARENVQPSLFADPQLEYREAIQFYQHDVDWANRMILGDSLQVMASLVHRENLAGKVQMIYIDPPYGIKFASNFQPEIGKRDVKDKESDLTREPEMVKAYRDTWTLGIHSYLSYLRDRLILARQLLADSGSVFVQIGEENLYRVTALLDEVFEPQNHVTAIAYKTSIGLGGDLLDSVCNYVVWYAKNKEQAEKRYHQLFQVLSLGDAGATRYSHAENVETGESRFLTEDEQNDPSSIVDTWQPFTDQGLTSRSGSDTTRFPVSFESADYRPTAGGWRTGQIGMARVLGAERVLPAGSTIRFKKFFRDFGALSLTNFWDDVSGGIQSRQDPKIFVVQTATKIIERCMLMTTDPGDLVLDPTCGSGTTAYVAEQWGRRWITIDTSRVALALARQRLLTATFPYFTTKTGNGNPAVGFIYKTVPHITLKSISQNTGLDAIFARHQAVLNEKLAALNVALKTVTSDLRQRLLLKLKAKEKSEGKRSVTDADRRRWELPKSAWQEWEVPFDTDEEWTPELVAALTDYRAAWRTKMEEVNAAIAANAEQEELVDQPQEDKKLVRVSGPFTMEAVMPLEESLVEESPIGGRPEEMETFREPAEPANVEAYLDKILRLLRADGVRFPNNKMAQFTELQPFPGGEYLHGKGEWESDGKTHQVAVSVGPEFGPVTAYQVENALRQAHKRGFDDLVIAGFSFDAEAQATIQEPELIVRCHLAHISPDVNMGDLLKETASSQIFTVFGSPRTELRQTKEGEYIIVMQGVDIYNPVDNTILPTNADKVAAWFVDSDYDGDTFCITQAFFPDKDAWDKLARALKGVIDEDRFEAFSGTESLPFPAGKHKRVAVKVIDPRGNEVMCVHQIGEGTAYAKR